MAYSIPTFNLLYNYYQVGGYNPTDLTYDFDTITLIAANRPGALRVNARMSLLVAGIHGWATLSQGVLLLVPKDTDIRDQFNNVNSLNVIEIPADTERYYAIQYVDDIAKGWINEYRVAGLIKMSSSSPFLLNGFDWPAPIP